MKEACQPNPFTIVLSYFDLIRQRKNMLTTKLSSKGQVILPKEILSRHHWEPGQELQAIDTDDGILLRPASSFPETTLEEVASCLSYSGKSKTLKEMEAAINKGVRSIKNERR
jgi:AbrB family looped-hinge helix DNA binding protein